MPVLRSAAVAPVATATLAFVSIVSPALANDFLVTDAAARDRIVRIEADTGLIIDHFVGQDITTIDGPGGMCFDPVSGDLLVTSQGTDSVYRFDGQTGQPIGLMPFITAGAGGLDIPIDIVFGPAGRFIVSSYDTDSVLAFGADGTPDAGGPLVTGIPTPTTLLLTDDGRLLVGSDIDNAVYQYDATTFAPIGDGVLVPSGSAGLDDVRGLLITDDGRLLVSSFDNDRILQFDAVTGEPVAGGTLVAQGAGGLDAPWGLVLADNGDLLVVSTNDNDILRFNASTGFFVGTFSEGFFVEPREIVRRFDADSCPSDVTGDGTVDFNDILRVIADFGDCL